MKSDRKYFQIPKSSRLIKKRLSDATVSSGWCVTIQTGCGGWWYVFVYVVGIWLGETLVISIS